ncbi:MAG TPA: carotenoid biosynthesis protein [Euzebya sp.]|nr:carotenoid biosynthesis protein [Euzebya sp.]
MTLAVLAVLSQVVYPLVSGPARDVTTIITVVLFSAASLSHAWVHRGWRTALAVAGVFAGGGLLIEVIGVATGLPFGDYAYGDRIGPTVGDVPMIIPMAWTMLGYPALVVARLITAHRWLGISVGAGALAAWDLYLDPQMVAEGHWRWFSDGPHLIGSVPVTNYLAWLGTSWLMMTALWPRASAWATAAHDDRVPVALYVWTWAGSLVAHVLLFDLPQSGLYGGLAMGLVVGLLAWRLRQPPAAAPTVPEVISSAGGMP